MKSMKRIINLLSAFVIVLSLFSCQKAKMACEDCYYPAGLGECTMLVINRSGQDVVLEYKGNSYGVAHDDTITLDSLIFSQLVYWKKSDSAVFAYGDTHITHTLTYIATLDTAVFSPEENNFFNPIYWKKIDVSYPNMTYTILPVNTTIH